METRRWKAMIEEKRLYRYMHEIKEETEWEERTKEVVFDRLPKLDCITAWLFSRRCLDHGSVIFKEELEKRCEEEHTQWHQGDAEFREAAGSLRKMSLSDDMSPINDFVKKYFNTLDKESVLNHWSVSVETIIGLLELLKKKVLNTKNLVGNGTNE